VLYHSPDVLDGFLQEDDKLEITSKLEKFDSLSTLALQIDGGSSDEERDTVKRWAGACKSLRRILLSTPS
jgi:hypothetical protein